MKFYNLFRLCEQHFREHYHRIIIPYCSNTFYGVIFSSGIVTPSELQYVLEHFEVGDDYFIDIFDGHLSIQFPHHVIDNKV